MSAFRRGQVLDLDALLSSIQGLRNLQSGTYGVTTVLGSLQTNMIANAEWSMEWNSNRDRDREEQGQVGNSSETQENSTHSGLSCGNGVPLLPILIHNSVYREARLRCLEDEE